jgi:uncharacterized lipoprotein NlpE involved in copper resistance
MEVQMARPKNHKTPSARNGEEDKTIDMVDDLREFREFKKKYLPAIRADLSAGMTPKQLREKYASLAQAAEIMDLLDPHKRATAAKNIIDRVEGKAIETVKHEHKYKGLKREQAEALLLSKLGALNKDDDKKANH